MLKATLLMLLTLVAGCSATAAPSEPVLEVATARARWTGSDTDDYRFDFERTCFCVEEYREPATIEVRGGVITSVRSLTSGEELNPAGPVEWFTIDELFALIEQAEAEGTPVRVEYAPEGYPAFMELGEIAADAGVQYRVRNLVALE